MESERIETEKSLFLFSNSRNDRQSAEMQTQSQVKTLGQDEAILQKEVNCKPTTKTIEAWCKSQKSHSFRVFNHSMKSTATRLTYVRSVLYFADEMVKRGVIESATDFDGLASIPMKELVLSLEDYIIDLADKVHVNTVPCRIYPLELFYTQNDVSVNWKRLHKMFPDKKKTGNRKAYSSEQITEIHRLVHQTTRNRAVVCFLATTGIRAGAIGELKKKDLEEYKNTYLVTVYSGCKEEYRVFCTPEAKKALDEYFEERESKGEKLDGNSFVFLNDFMFGKKQIKNRYSANMSYGSLSKIIDNSLKKSPLLSREKSGGDMRDRYNVAMVHGIRKFFATAVSNSKVSSNVQALFLGHISKNLEVSTYVDWDNKDSVETMYREYIQCLPALAVSERQKAIYGIEQAKSMSTETELQYAEDIKQLKAQNELLQQQVSNSQMQLAKLLSRVGESGNLSMIDGKIVTTYTDKQREMIERE